jgi:hypothetical protein
MTYPPPPTGAATGSADQEAGTDGAPPAEERRRALFALDAMKKRGLIDDAAYAARRAEIMAGSQE